MAPYRSRSGPSGELKHALSIRQHIDHARARSGDADFGSDAHFASGFDERFQRPSTERFEQEQFDAAILGEEAGLDDAGIVQDRQIAGLQVGRKVPEGAVFDLSGFAVRRSIRAPSRSGRGRFAMSSSGRSKR